MPTLCSSPEDCPEGTCCWNFYECLDPKGVLSTGDKWPSRCGCRSNDFCRSDPNGTKIDGLCCDQFQETCQPDHLGIHQPGDICMGAPDPYDYGVLPWVIGVLCCITVLSGVAIGIHCKRRQRRQLEQQRQAMLRG